MRLAGTAQISSVDGPGLRYVIFTQGCLHCCPYCHNPDSWDVVTYTGFTYEELIADNSDGVKALLAASDILIDGRYIHKLRDTKLQFRGSSNQRIIDVAATQTQGRIVLWNEKG